MENNMAYIIDLKDRTVAEFTKDELINFAPAAKKTNKNRFWVVENKKQAVKVIKKLIKKGF
jgi:hypothetical protein